MPAPTDHKHSVNELDEKRRRVKKRIPLDLEAQKKLGNHILKYDQEHVDALEKDQEHSRAFNDRLAIERAAIEAIAAEEKFILTPHAKMANDHKAGLEAEVLRIQEILEKEGVIERKLNGLIQSDKNKVALYPTKSGQEYEPALKQLNKHEELLAGLQDKEHKARRALKTDEVYLEMNERFSGIINGDEDLVKKAKKLRPFGIELDEHGPEKKGGPAKPRKPDGHNPG